VELICDGVHIAPSVVRATFRLFGDDRVVLISDSMEATGKPDGQYSLGGLDVHVKGNYATLADGTLAGSVTPLYKCLLTAVSMGIPLESAIKSATINACRSIGIDDTYGSIKEGKKAHFLILNKEDLSIKAIIKGQLHY
jgi:N-acetylglucosamine-6-phosphate deacetylase